MISPPLDRRTWERQQEPRRPAVTYIRRRSAILFIADDAPDGQEKMGLVRRIGVSTEHEKSQEAALGCA